MIECLNLKRTDRIGRHEEAPLDLREARVYGNERVVRCPFHPDEKPSLWINLDKLCFHCFGCEASGMVTATMDEARELPRFLPRLSREAPPELREERHRILSDALGFYQLQLPYAEAYLKARGVSMETASEWGCGVCGYQPLAHFLRYMREKGWESTEPLLRHSLLRVSPNGVTIASLRGRVIFPLTCGGLISNLAGRHLLRHKELKWLFLKNAQGVPKGIFAEKNLRGARAILTESIFDALPWLERERPAVALMGVSLPEWTIQYLQGKEVYFALNSDEAGALATQRQVTRLQGVAKEVRFIRLPSGFNDWNEYHCERNRALGIAEAP